jgi:hypothetical protein
MIGSCSYTFSKIFGIRFIYFPEFGVFPFRFDVDNMGNIYFSLKNGENLSLCKLEYDSEKIIELVNLKGRLTRIILSEDEKKILYEKEGYFEIYSLVDKKVTKLLNIERYNPISFAFADNDSTIIFYGNVFDDSKLDLKNYRLSYQDFYEYNLANSELKRISYEHFRGPIKFTIFDQKIFFILQCESFTMFWKERFNNGDIQIKYRDPYDDGYYLFDRNSRTLESMGFLRNYDIHTRDIEGFGETVYIEGFSGFYEFNITKRKVKKLAEKIDNVHFDFLSTNKRLNTFRLFDDQKKAMARNYKKNDAVFVVYDIEKQTIEREIVLSKDKFISLGNENQFEPKTNH